MANDGTGITIIKRKKVSGGGGHHGGAWKVAYADFVTAMMAFFLLMWLLNATTENQRQGIADYFAPTVPVSPISGGGNGVLSGASVFSAEELSQEGTGGETESPQDEKGGAADATGGPTDDSATDAAEAEEPLSELESELRGMSGESDTADDLLSHIVTRVTDEGLVIDVFAKEGQPLFATGSDAPTEKMQSILQMVAGVIGLVKNEIAVTGHTDASTFQGGDMDNWRLSTARANSSRQALVAAGVDPERISRVTGKAAKELAIPSEPLDPRNRRITLILLRSDR